MVLRAGEWIAAVYDGKCDSGILEEAKKVVKTIGQQCSEKFPTFLVIFSRTRFLCFEEFWNVLERFGLSPCAIGTVMHELACEVGEHRT